MVKKSSLNAIAKISGVYRRYVRSYFNSFRSKREKTIKRRCDVENMSNICQQFSKSSVLLDGTDLCHDKTV